MADSSSPPLPIHLFLVTNTLEQGGAEEMLIRLARQLDRRRIEPAVVCLKGPGPLARELEHSLIPCYSHNLSHKFDLSVIPRLARLLRGHRPACIMAVGSGGDRMFWSTLAAQWARCPAIVWAHLLPVPGQPEFEWMNRRLYRWVDRFVAVGRRHAEAMAEFAGIPPGRVSVIRNGIDPAEFDQVGHRDEARRMLGLGTGQTAIGLIANLKPVKRPDLFVEAAARVHRLRPAARFFMIGDGSSRPQVELLIRQRQLDRGTMILLGLRQDVPALMQALDIVCLTSERECLSVAMLEAMAAGKPFVAPRVGSLDEALIDGETGRFFEPATPDRLAEVLVGLIDEPAERERLGEAARAKVRAEFTTEQMARGFEELIVGLFTRGG